MTKFVAPCFFAPRRRCPRPMAYAGPCMHEFVMCLQDLKDATGCSAMDVAKGLLDHGIHPPTMYFPLIVHEALMVEPTETESQETMDGVCGVFLHLWDVAHDKPQALHDAPTRTPVRRLSGGGAVFHDMGNLNFTFLVNKADYDLPRQLGVIVEACRAMGIPAERSGRNGVLSGGRKFSGNAFYEHRGKSYHHGTLLVDADMSAMDRYLSPSRAELEAKGVSSVRSRVVNLKELKPDLTVEEMAEGMEAALRTPPSPQNV